MANRKPIRKIYSPMVWPTWALVGCAWLVARLPISVVFAIGSGLGRLFYRFGGSRRRITEINIERCFPELSAKEQRDLVRSNFRQVAIGAVEMAIPCAQPKARPIGPVSTSTARSTCTMPPPKAKVWFSLARTSP